MSVRALAISAAVSVSLALLFAWAWEVPIERAFMLAPFLVVFAGVIAMVAVILTRAAIDSARELQNPRRFWIGMGVAFVAIAVLSVLGVQLPREGG